MYPLCSLLPTPVLVPSHFALSSFSAVPSYSYLFIPLFSLLFPLMHSSTTFYVLPHPFCLILFCLCSSLPLFLFFLLPPSTVFRFWYSRPQATRSQARTPSVETDQQQHQLQQWTNNNNNNNKPTQHQQLPSSSLFFCVVMQFNITIST